MRDASTTAALRFRSFGVVVSDARDAALNMPRNAQTVREGRAHHLSLLLDRAFFPPTLAAEKVNHRISTGGGKINNRLSIVSTRHEHQFRPQPLRRAGCVANMKPEIRTASGSHIPSATHTTTGLNSGKTCLLLRNQTHPSSHKTDGTPHKSTCIHTYLLQVDQ